jgi:UDP-N-acetylmuramate--alanine ligase
MILNSLAVIAVSHYLNISKEDIIQNLSEFRGAKRRFQEKKYKDNIIIDDYAHHPVEIMATLGAARQKYPHKKIVAAFQPYHYDRTSFFAYEMAEALNMADVAYVFDIKFSDPPSAYPGITNELIIKHLNNGYALRHDENIVDKEKDSVIIFMSPSEIKMCKDIVNQEEDVNKLVKRK